jgi:hypothetical protein
LLPHRHATGEKDENLLPHRHAAGEEDENLLPHRHAAARSAMNITTATNVLGSIKLLIQCELNTRQSFKHAEWSAANNVTHIALSLISYNNFFPHQFAK